LIGWATAWSFDRLRLWIERGADPQVSLQRSLIHGLARVAVAFTWAYQGLVPKLLVMHRDETALLLEAGVAPTAAQTIVLLAGWAEVLLGVALLAAWRTRWLFLVTVGLMVAALLAVALRSPAYLVAAFNPVTLNVAVMALALIGYVAGADLPSARQCRRRRPEKGA
jgi:hypothetical protein